MSPNLKVDILFLLLTITSSVHVHSTEVVRESRSIDVATNSGSKLYSQDAVSSDKPVKTIQRLVGGHVNNNNYQQVITINANNDQQYKHQSHVNHRENFYVNGHANNQNLNTNRNNGNTGTSNRNERPEILRMESAGGGKDSKQKIEGDEDTKTLSQQVADGKYGLIQNELFSKKIKRPGILSYKGNPEVPKDTKSNLGGLAAEDIWLAEDHLLVLKGASFPDHSLSKDVSWPPIDDYKAPRRQVKIPTNPAVPPPFPVQLQDDGPVQFIGANGTSTKASLPPPYPPEGYVPGSGPFFPFGAGNLSQAEGPFPPPLPPFVASLPPGAAYLPPPNRTNFSIDEDDPSIYYPPPYSFYYPKDNTSAIPAGPLVPGIILPPPPDFFAPLEETTEQEKSTPITTTTTTEPPKQIHPTTAPPTLRPLQRPAYERPISIRPIYKEDPLRTPKPNLISTRPTYKPVHRHPPTQKITQPIYVPDIEEPEKVHINIPSEIDNSLQSLTTPSPQVHTVTPVHKIKITTPYNPTYFYTSQPGISVSNVNIPKRTKVAAAVNPTPSYYNDYSDNYYETNSVASKNNYYGQSERVRNPYTLGRSLVSTTAVPLKAFFTSGRGLDTNVGTVDPLDYFSQAGLATRTSPKPRAKPHAAYYYYEEDQTTTNPQNDYRYYNGNTRVPNRPQQYYYVSADGGQSNGYVPSQRQQYYEPTLRPDILSKQIARLRQEIQAYLTTPNRGRQNYNLQTTSTPKPVYQYSFQAADYIPTHLNGQQNDNDDPFRPIVGYTQYQHENVYQTTQEPIYDYDKPEVSTESPIKYSPQSKYEAVVTVTPPNLYQARQQSRQIKKQHNQQYRSTPRPAYATAVRATPNPIDHAYYTKQDEQLFDDITKQYFTVFGQKVQNGNDPGVTESLKRVEVTTVRSPLVNEYLQEGSREVIVDQRLQNSPDNIEVHFGDNTQASQTNRPPTLHGDTNVNYKSPHPQIHPESEFVPIVNPAYRQLSRQRVVSLESDIAVNDKYPRPGPHPHAEIINPGAIHNPPRVNISLERDIAVNYKNPRPTPNPHAELININRPHAEQIDINKRPYIENIETFYHNQNYRPTQEEELVDQNIVRANTEQIRNYEATHRNVPVISNGYVQEHPVKTNNEQPFRPIRVQSNIGQQIRNPHREPSKYQQSTGEGRPGSFISYQLPGNGAHFYFLTPQAVGQQKQEQGNYGYQTSSQAQRLRRSRIRQHDTRNYQRDQR